MKVLDLPIDMIATFTGTRNPIPYKFRYMDRSGERIEVKIDRITRTETMRLSGEPVILYTCQSRVGDFVRLYELKYIIPQYRWELHKI